MDIYRVSGDCRPNDASNTLRRPQVPNLDVPIPAAGDDKVRVLADELGAEDSVGVAGESTATAFERLRQLPRLLVVYAHFTVFTSGEEGSAILLEVTDI